MVVSLDTLGEIAIVLGLAFEVANQNKVPLDEAIDLVVARRRTGASRAEIAHDLDLRLEMWPQRSDKSVASRQRPDKVERANNGERPEVGQPKKIEKPVMPKRPEKPATF